MSTKNNFVCFIAEDVFGFDAMINVYIGNVYVNLWRA